MKLLLTCDRPRGRSEGLAWLRAELSKAAASLGARAATVTELEPAGDWVPVASLLVEFEIYEPVGNRRHWADVQSFTAFVRDLQSLGLRPRLAVTGRVAYIHEGDGS